MARFVKSTVNRKKDLENNAGEKYDSFHNAIRGILLFAQCFAIMPLKGLYSDRTKDIKLVLKYPGTLVTITFLIAGGLSTLSFAKELILIGINAKNIGNYKSGKLFFKSYLSLYSGFDVGLIFFSCGLTACTLFLLMAREWNSIIEKWTQVDLIFLRMPCYKPLKWTLEERVFLVAVVVGLLSVGEYLNFISVSM
ncbi:Gr64a.2 family protein [Megaselia abdita]